MQRFADPDQVTEGWYVLGRSKDLKRGALWTVPVGKREVVAYRALDGQVRAVDARCGHLGSHLGAGSVTADGIRCSYHGWSWGSDGACARVPDGGPLPERRMRAYEAGERYGLVWAWLGKEPRYGIPDAGAPASWREVVLPPRVVKAHPHLVMGNAFDLQHLGPAHGLDLREEPVVKLDPPHVMEMVTHASLPGSGPIRWSGMGRKRVTMWYATHGASVTLVHVRAPIEFRVLFTGRPDPHGHTRAQTVLFLPRRTLLPRALALLWGTTIQDIKILESLDFRPAFDPARDGVLAAYARHVEAMPTW